MFFLSIFFLCFLLSQYSLDGAGLSRETGLGLNKKYFLFFFFFFLRFTFFLFFFWVGRSKKGGKGYMEGEEGIEEWGDENGMG